MKKWEMPEDANPCPGMLYMINPNKKFEEEKGMNPKEHLEFSGVCGCGPDQLIVCYQCCDAWYHKVDFEIMCGECKYCLSDYKRTRDREIFNIWLPDYLEMPYFKENIQEHGNGPYVYFISDGEYIKIGVAIDIKKRMNQIQNGNPRKISLQFAIPCVSKYDAFSLENKLHRIYRKYKTLGEWYDILKKLDMKAWENRFYTEKNISAFESEKVV